MAIEDFFTMPVAGAAALFTYLGHAIGSSSGQRSMAKKANSTLGWRANENERLRLDAETRYIDVLRRELANIIVTDNPAAMGNLYRKCWAFELEMQKADASRVESELTVLTARYPLYVDFDLLGTRHFIPYSDATNMLSEDDIVDRYQDISKFIVLRGIIAKSSQPIFSEYEDTILQKTMRRETDRRFRLRTIDAIERYDLVRYSTNRNLLEPFEYECRDYSVTPLDHFAESRWGIYFKDTQECAIYSVFYGDDSKSFKSFYRSDIRFQEETNLMVY
jgi:hypothetical protein